MHVFSRLDIKQKYSIQYLAKGTICISSTVLGYVASAGHGIAAAATGNEEDLQRARRACASSIKSTLTTAGALAAGPGGM